MLVVFSYAVTDFTINFMLIKVYSFYSLKACDQKLFDQLLNRNLKNIELSLGLFNLMRR